MKKKLLSISLLSFVLCFALNAQFTSEIRERMQSLSSNVEVSLRENLSGVNGTISVLPIGGDQGSYMTGLLKNAITNAGLDYVEGSTDPFWNVVLQEVEWDERKADMLDPTTLVTFGKLKATQNIMYGVLREAKQTGNRIYVELELHLSSIKTKQHLWGDIFVERFYLPGQQNGIVNLTPEVKQALKKSIDSGAMQVNSNARLAQGLTVAVTPLAGDIDNYVTELVQNMLSNTQVLPKRFAANTRAQTVELLRANPKLADAVLYGSIRDLSVVLEKEELKKQTYELSAEVQVHIEDAKSGEVLWSGNLSTVDYYVEEDTWYELIMGNKTLLLYVVGGFIALIVLLIIFKGLLGAMTRVR